MRKLILCLTALTGGLVLASCDNDYHTASVGGSYGTPTSNVDFYYSDNQPYSTDYGPLYYRDGGYFYVSGGNYVPYTRETYASNDTRVINRETTVKNVNRVNKTVYNEGSSNTLAARDARRHTANSQMVVASNNSKKPVAKKKTDDGDYDTVDAKGRKHHHHHHQQ